MKKRPQPLHQRQQSAKVLRHQDAIEKYRNFEANKINEVKLKDMMQGEKSTNYVNKPGQYLIVTTGKDTSKDAHLDIPLMNLLDGTKTFSELKTQQRQEKLKNKRTLPSAKTFNFPKSANQRPQTAKHSLGSNTQGNFFEKDDNFIQIDEADDSFHQKEVSDQEYANFILKDNSSKSLLTRDLRTATRKQHTKLFSPSSKIIKEVVVSNVNKEGNVQKKTSQLLKRVESANLKPLNQIKFSQPQSAHGSQRPISSQFMLSTLQEEKVDKIEKSNVLKNAMEHDKKTFQKSAKKKKTSYIVHKKNQTASHIMGYNTIQLTPQDVRPSEIEYEKQKEIIKESKIKMSERLNSAIDYSKQSPFLTGDEQAELHIAQELGLPTGPKDFQDIKEDKEGFFLPLDYYNFDDDDLDPEKTLEKYKKLSGNNPIQGYSKWFLNNGQFQWKLCTVLGWQQEEQRFKIQWESGKIKLVSRVNLRFKQENEKQFEKKLEAAEYYREMSEVYLKYNYMIDSMFSPTSQISQDMLERIQLFTANFPFKLGKLRDLNEFHNMATSIKYNCKRAMFPKVINTGGKQVKDIYQQKQYNLKSVPQIIEEIKQVWIRANHQIEFNNSLPFSEDNQNLFKGYIPDHLFLSPIEAYQSKEVPQYALIQIKFPKERKKSDFIKDVNILNDKIHYSHADRLKIMQDLQKNLQQYIKTPWVLTQFKQQFQFEQFKKKMDALYQDRLREFKSQLYDTNFELMDIIDIYAKQVKLRNQELMRKVVTIEQKNKLQQEVLSDQIKQQMQAFQGLLNYNYEEYGRQSFQFSMDTYIKYFLPILNHFKQANNLPFNKNSTDIKQEPFQVSESTITYDQIINYQFEVQKGPIFQQGQFQAILKLEIIDIVEEGTERKLKEYKITPSISQWKEYLLSIFPSIIEIMQTIPCLKSSNIEPARKDELLKILRYDEKDKDDQYALNLYQKYRDNVSNVINQVFTIPEMFEKQIQEFQFLVEQTPDSLKKLNKKINSFKEFEEEIQRVKHAQEKLKKILFDDQMTLGIFMIDVAEFHNFVGKQISRAADSIYKNLITKITKENEKIQKETQKIEEKLAEEPTTIEELDALRKYCKVTLEEELDIIKQRIDDTMEKLNLFEVMWVKISEDDFEQTWRIYGLPLEIRIKRDETLQRLKKQEEVFSQSLTGDQAQILLDIKDINVELEFITKEKEKKNFKAIYDKFANLGDKIQKTLNDADIINRREVILKWKETDYQELKKIEAKWYPYNQVWKYANDYHFTIKINTLDTPISNIDSDFITDFINSATVDMVKLEKNQFKQLPDMKMVTMLIRRDYEEFAKNLPLINYLKNPNLKATHWVRINQAIQDYNNSVEDESQKMIDNSPGGEGAELQIDEEQSIQLNTMLDAGILNIEEQIRDISEVASKEKGFEKMLNKMKNDWKPVKLELQDYKDTQTFILKGVDPIMDKLDEDISKTLSIASSPYIKFLEKDVMQWKDNLFKLQETIEAWLKVQKMWTYLQPIFYSEDIIKEMAKEGNKYSIVDSKWKQIMTNAQSQPTVMEACFQPRQKENFYQMIESLEQVIKGLNEYLNKKRLAFPRFFFLSDDELLQILAQTREPRAVQKHMPKCFEGIDLLHFQNDMLVTAIESSEKEVIQLEKHVNPLDNDKNPRGVEQWLQEIEDSMKESLRVKLISTLKDYPGDSTEALRKTRTDTWIKNGISQLIVTSDQAIWTSGVTEALKQLGKNNQALIQYQQKLEDLLQDIVKLVRTETSKVLTITLGVLVVIEVHQKDVVQEMITQRVNNAQAFEWLAQMRYYQETKSMKVKMVSTTRDYGYEYLGNQGRLVITPLTDRCFRTLMSALSQNLGGAPEGPAGTGKTETTKDLAKAIAKHCVVFNCSDQLDYKAMGKFFKGLISCGSWACFDEFNRIELEVLSVIAQQIWKIQNGILKMSLAKHPSKEFDFEGSILSLNPTCAVFITMNPGYQGRSELPDNLKALFRPVAMMIPNYAMITEISLYSYGFTNARALSIKITTSLKLASEQLSTQSHYDFGMRAIKAIIMAAGNLKRSKPQDDESYLCLTAIGDCNLPKFTKEDVGLFQAIITDLFPDTEKQHTDFKGLDICIKKIVQQDNHVMSDRFFQKIIELYETIKVRHGLMVVGSASSGKSTIIDTLRKSIERHNEQKALIQAQVCTQDDVDEENELELSETEEKYKDQAQNDAFSFLKKEEEPEEPLQRRVSIYERIEKRKNIKYQKVDMYSLNPKSITTKMLFGDFDDAGEWHNGITANLFRECYDAKNGNMSWVIFDGPVDALWIENMNTVLDDNKKLCLTNGETIKLVDDMNIMFEVEDLLEASPATVSRCGMVYLESGDIGWRVLFTPWVNQLFEDQKTFYLKRLYQEIVDLFVEPTMKYIFKNKHMLAVQMTQSWLFKNFLKIFQCFLGKGLSKKQYQLEREKEIEKHQAKIRAYKLEGKDINKLIKKDVIQDLKDKNKGEIVQIAFQALIWSFGAAVGDEHRNKFDHYLITLLSDFQKENTSWISSNQIPSEEYSIYDQRFDLEKKTWVPWKSGPEYVIPKTITQFHEIFIPTGDSIRHHQILKSLTINEYPCLFSGKTGTGKTIIMKKFLLNDLESLPYKTTVTSFSANTNCSQVQDVLESKLEKTKRKRGVYGPIIGYTNTIFIDDLNMPKKETYGAQPPLELIRQWFAYGGWYDRKTLEFNKIVDIQFTGCMGIGRPALSQRLLRNFSFIHLNEMEDKTLSDIVTKVFNWGFDEYVDKVKFLVDKLTSLTTMLHDKVSQQFLPLPSKSHYLFNLRDLMKVVQGVLNVPPTQYDANSLETDVKIYRLWYHESICIYADRLVNKEDKDNFNEIAEEVLIEKTSYTIQNITQYKDQETHKVMHSTLMYSDFLDNRDYCEIPDIKLAKQAIQDAIYDYNKKSKKKIDIILFEDAIRMLCKINRIISSPFGHALMIGLGGSGSHTLTRLVSFLQNFQLFEIELEADFGPNDWLEYIRVMLRDIVMADQGGVFLIGDAQLISEKFLEDINNLLNIGEIPNLYPIDDKESMLQDIKDKHKLQISSMALWEYFVNKCKSNLHIAACLSPIGDKLRTRLRNFPSLISCTSPIWVQPWSEEALSEVAYYTLEMEAEEMLLDEDKINKISQIYLNFHTSVSDITQVYLQETGKRYYVTPISYLKLLSNFKNVYTSKLDELVNQRDTYINGVEKLDSCQIIVDKLKDEITAKQPILQEKTIETEQIMKKVEKENIEAEKHKEKVQVDEISTAQKQEVAQKVENKCKAELGQAEPKLQEAIAALRTLKPQDFVEIKSLQKPPFLIKMTMEAVCIMMHQKGKKGEKGATDYWDDARKLLQEPQKLLKKLVDYDKNNIQETVINKMKTFLKNNEKQFTPATIKKASNACEGLCKWVLAIYEYHWVYQAILPLRKDLAEAQEQLDTATKQLQAKRDELALIEKKCQDLRDQFEEANLTKQKLIAEIQDCKLKLERAQQLTRSLSSEQERWKNSSVTLKVEITNLLGDILLAVGSLSYLGAFTGEYRKRLIQKNWIPKILESNIICSQDFSLVQRLGDPLELQEWELHGLPLDEVSKENALIMKTSDNWPLIIDPQNQAKKFIKRLETKNDPAQFLQAKPGKTLDKYLELAVRDGKTLLVDGCQENLPPILDQVLIKNNISIQAGKKVVTLGIGTIEFNENFRLYLICNMQNPHYTPDTLTKVTLLQYTITQEAAKDQMLSILSKEEDEALENEKIRLMFENADNRKKMNMVEKNILHLLQITEPQAMLEDDNLIIELKDSKKISEEVEQRQREAKGTEEKIKQMKINYSGVANMASEIYFTVLQLSKLDPMYQFSLEFYVKIFRKSIKTAEKVPKSKVEMRVNSLQESLKKCVYFEMQRSLFVKHKVLFSLMLTFTILKCQDQQKIQYMEDNDQDPSTYKRKLDQELYNYMLSGLSGKPLIEEENPDNDYFTDKQWNNILHLNNLQAFEHIAYNIGPNLETWQKYFDDICNQEIELPEPFDKLSPFAKLVLCKAVRPDQYVNYSKIFISQVCGDYFIQNLIITLETSFNESEAQVPLIFLLTPGDDPQEELKRFAQEKGKYITFQSLGKGQGDAAEHEIREAMQAGQWILLQNCHLAVSWLPRLEEIMEEFQAKILKKDHKDRSINPEFRIWLTSMSSDAFPMQLLQEGIKMTKDPPKGVKANVLQLYHNQNSTKEDKKYFETSSKPEEWQKLFMCLTFFHAIIRERRRYGPIGWNIYYDFNQSDFRISRSQLKDMIEDYDEIPYKALTYLTGECYYGGKVTDDWDRKVILAILSGFYHFKALHDEYQFSPVPEFKIPNFELMENLDMTIEYLNELPDKNDPELFGLHPNAIISSATFECNFMIQSIIEISQQSGGQSSDKNEMIKKRAQELLEGLPNNFDIPLVREKFKIEYYQSMNTVLIQEVLRYNTLLNYIRNSLNDLIDALGGIKVMTNQLENIIEGMLNNSIPQVWLKKSFPSLKTLAGYMSDIVNRVYMFEQWIADGKAPAVFQLPCFYFTQSFFTGVRQNHARKHKIPIDQINFDFKVIEQDDFDEPPENGCYTNGLYIEGARWEYGDHRLAESYPNTIFESMPIIQFVPINGKREESKKFYECPVYKTTERKGTLSTTGHSTNFILSIFLPINVDPDHWVKRGVAMIASLDD